MSTPSENGALLRQAADKLDKLAASAAKGPWEAWPLAEMEKGCRCGSCYEAPWAWGINQIDGQGISPDGCAEPIHVSVENVEWIETMGPQVAAPIAAWLRAEADCFENTPATTRALTDIADAVTGEKWGVRALLSTEEQAVAVARAILGEAR